MEVNSRILLVGFVLWPPEERRLQFLVFMVFPGLNQHNSLPPKTKGEGKMGDRALGPSSWPGAVLPSLLSRFSGSSSPPQALASSLP